MDRHRGRAAHSVNELAARSTVGTRAAVDVAATTIADKPAISESALIADGGQAIADVDQVAHVGNTGTAADHAGSAAAAIQCSAASIAHETAISAVAVVAAGDFAHSAVARRAAKPGHARSTAVVCGVFTITAFEQPAAIVANATAVLTTGRKAALDAGRTAPLARRPANARGIDLHRAFEPRGTGTGCSIAAWLAPFAAVIAATRRRIQRHADADEGLAAGATTADLADLAAHWIGSGVAISSAAAAGPTGAPRSVHIGPGVAPRIRRRGSTRAPPQQEGKGQYRDVGRPLHRSASLPRPTAVGNDKAGRFA